MGKWTDKETVISDRSTSYNINDEYVITSLFANSYIS